MWGLPHARHAVILSLPVIILGQYAVLNLLVNFIARKLDNEERVELCDCVGLLGSLTSAPIRTKGWADTLGLVSGLADSCTGLDR